MTNIGRSAFENCKSLSSITIPDGVTSIGSYTFSNCRSLSSITLSKNLTSIGYHAFNGCAALSSITLPESLTAIGDHAFVSCSFSSIFSKAIIPPKIEDGSAFQGINETIPVYVPKESVDAYKTAIGWTNFTNFLGLETSTQQVEQFKGLKISNGKLYNADGLFIEIFNVNGQPVYKGRDVTVCLSSGIYIIRCKSSCFNIKL